MNEKLASLSLAEIYVNSLLSMMTIDAGNCSLYTTLLSEINHDPLIKEVGSGGGSESLSINSRIRLREIHRPKCELLKKRGKH